MNSRSVSLSANKDLTRFASPLFTASIYSVRGMCQAFWSHQILLLKDLNSCSAFGKPHRGRRCGFIIRVRSNICNIARQSHQQLTLCRMPIPRVSTLQTLCVVSVVLHFRYHPTTPYDRSLRSTAQQNIPHLSN